MADFMGLMKQAAQLQSKVQALQEGARLVDPTAWSVNWSLLYANRSVHGLSG